MAETLPTSTRFMNIFVDDEGTFRWKIDDRSELSAELTAENGDTVLFGAEYDNYQMPYIYLAFRGEEDKRYAHVDIESPAEYWVRETDDGYEMPLAEVDSLLAVVEGDEWGLRRYSIPDSKERSVTVAKWSTEFRDTTDPESQGGWSVPERVKVSEGLMMRSLVEQTVQATVELSVD